MKRQSERGSVFLGVMLMLVPICALVGLVTDVGWWYFTAQSATAAAESAALAAVRSAVTVASTGGSYACGTQVVCQSPLSCASATGNLSNGCSYAVANGYTDGGLSGRQTVTIEANTTSPIDGVAIVYWVRVRIAQQNPLTFLGVLGQSTIDVGVRSTAALVNKVPNACVTALDPSASSAFTISGSSSVTLSNCAAQVNSSAANALNLNGGGCLTASAVEVSGGVSGSCVSPAATSGAPAAVDPYEFMAAPNISGLTVQNIPNKINSSPINPLSPGIYPGGISIGSATVTLDPGIYILEGGGMSCNAGCNLTGTGVTIYNTCTSGFCDGGSSGYKPINISGQGVVTLSAPTDASAGGIPGILFFEDRTVNPPNGSTDNVQGGSSGSLSGVLYFPNTSLKFAGGFSSGSTSTYVIADQVSFAGNSSLQVSLSNPPAWAPTISLLE